MNWKPIKCYLCNKDAEKWFTLGNLRVRPLLLLYASKELCECGYYWLTPHVLKYRMDDQRKILVTKEKKPLTEKQKWSLSSFVKNNQDPIGEKPVRLDLGTFDSLISSKCLLR